MWVTTLQSPVRRLTFGCRDMSERKPNLVALPTTLRLSADWRRIKAAATAQKIDVTSLSDAQAILHEMFPDVHTTLDSFTSTKSDDGHSILYRLTYITGEFDLNEGMFVRMHRETREIIIDDNLSASSDTITHSQG